MFQVLRQGNVALLWGAGVASSLGNWALVTALPFHVYALTSSAAATGLMFIVETVPRVLFGSVAGVLADRWDRRRIMVLVNLAQAGLVLVLLAVQSVERLWLVYLVGAGLSTLGTLFGPAKDALLPTLVDDRRLPDVNAINALGNEFARLAGPPLGGTLFALTGVSGVVLANAVTFFISAALVAGMSSPPQPSAAPRSGWDAWRGVWREWLEGLAHVRGSGYLLVLFCSAGAANVAEGLYSALFVVWLERVLEAGAEAFGWMKAAQALGGILAGLLFARVTQTIGLGHLVWLSALLGGGLFLAMVHIPSLPLVVGLYAPLGVLLVWYFVGLYTALQKGTSDSYRGRVFGAYYTTSALFMLVGMVLGSALADRTGVVLLLTVDAGFYLLAGVLVVLERGRYKA